MLQRFLSVTTVKIVCCHIAIPHTLRDELTCGSFQLYIWRLNLYYILFSKTSWFTTRQILISEFYNAYDFGLKKKYNVLDFE